MYMYILWYSFVGCCQEESWDKERSGHHIKKPQTVCEANEGVGIPSPVHANGVHVVIYVSELKCMSNHLTFLYMPMHLTNIDICQSNLLTYAQLAHLSMQGKASHS